ncbi:hypothetical protein BLNAU_24225 [Blattamonas nauphoetae]|uniref:Uncharacterized protein n=1 Tax=Blattamonas nauphoetae TaxID=2049346 RepID=A0ABQ9WQ20_9EUKA|nr:hypothetical protein BLNAU_24225 [Blattamonas nauphoetae]
MIDVITVIYSPHVVPIFTQRGNKVPDQVLRSIAIPLDISSTQVVITCLINTGNNTMGLSVSFTQDQKRPSVADVLRTPLKCWEKYDFAISSRRSHKIPW